MFCSRCDGLNAFYGTAQALEGVSFSLGHEAVAVIGRNGMGKTTLCNALMGITQPPQATGSARFRGAELLGRPSYKIAGEGISYVPQGSRLVRVSVHARAPEDDPQPGRRSGRWTAAAVVRAVPTSGRADERQQQRSCRAASNRCWPSAVRCSRTPSC